ncbi:MAG: response regulator, partial [Gloeomargaritaceae cyanobacterium C42_A2020_066]|nr:response regulator [Gloeomargaritaceae cyanobacterium C42_A2020_066]
MTPPDPASTGDLLIVDDTPQNVRLLSAILAKQGFEVRKALSGAMALLAIKAGRPDLILLDVMMPDMDGFQVCRRLKADPATQDIPIVFLSAADTPAYKVEAFRAGGADYITKPFQVEEVLARVEHQLALSRLRNALAIQNQQLQEEITQRQEVEQSLARSNALLRAQAEASLDGILVVDEHRRIISYNQRFCDLWQIRPAALAVMSLPDLIQQTASQVPNPEEFARRMEVKYAEPEATHTDRVILGDGRTFDCYSTPIRNINGDIYGRVCFMRDITEWLMMERMKDEFIAVVSHELRTPLTAIHGALGLLATGQLGTLTERGQRLVEIANKNTDRLVRLVRDLLEVDRLDSGRAMISLQTCNAADLVTQAIESVLTLAEASSVHLNSQVMPVSLEAHPDRIIQVLINLLSNAIKFSESGGEVWVSISSQGDTVQFDVADTGPGIPADQLEAVFDRFHQVDASDSRRRGGTGLGLAICRSIVQQHG